MAGGKKSFAAGGYFESAIDPLLPVSMELKQEHRKLMVAMAIENRLVTEKADWSIYVTDEGQSGHFKLVFGAARKSGLLVPEGAPGPRVTHVGFGLVLGDDGKRFRTRSSEVIVSFPSGNWVIRRGS